ncbi:hypothetical protein NKW84_03740 [Acetobacter senegalensis]|uniref:hypothetical protein n=1 Tax=Acetobacter senegalensis TaxID=446692 RepID=UPI00209C72FF|nr:hypothetical protein [Acetobacter senegalensis]MCP1194975.1 hypothetical protein [Acetobacter senegalensis]
MSCLKAKKRYLAELSLCLGLYVCAVFLVAALFDHHSVAAPWQPVVALLPMLPGAGFCWVIMRQFGRMDELQRRMQFEALGFSFAGTALLTFSYGFLETVGFAKISMFSVWGIMAALWCVGMAVAKRRYG